MVSKSTRQDEEIGPETALYVGQNLAAVKSRLSLSLTYFAISLTVSAALKKKNIRARFCTVPLMNVE